MHTFGAGSDGVEPVGNLIEVKGTLYGTTNQGGSSSFGTVYGVSLTGSEKVLYSFGNSPDGAYPSAGLIDVGGTLYGTTTSGGITGCQNYGCGVVYRISTSGKEKLVYSFIPSSDGPYNPAAGLIDVNGILYSTATYGGNDYGCSDEGCGIVFSVTTAGAEKTLHLFLGGHDGAYPTAALTNVNGVLYGTTPTGGPQCWRHLGCGTVFALTP